MTIKQLSIDDVEVSEISPDHTVNQSNNLIAARQDLNIHERRIIYAFASLIRKDDESFRTHRIKVKDIAQLIGIQEKNYYKKVQEIVVGLQQKGVYIRKENSELYVNWVSSSEYYHGHGSVEIEFSQKMRPYLLQLKKQFTPIKLRNILRLKSEYSMRIYEILKKDEYLKKTTYTLKELRVLVGLEKDKYERYTHFKQRILSRAQEELANQTDIQFKYREIKEGRKVTALAFTIESTKNYVEHVIEKIDNDNEIITLLSTYGVAKMQSQRLLNTYSIERIVKNLEYVSSRKKNIHNVAGAIVDAIKNDYVGIDTEDNTNSPDQSLNKDHTDLVIQKFLIDGPKDDGTTPSFLIEEIFKKWCINEGNLSSEDTEYIWKEHQSHIVKEYKTKAK